MSKFYRFFKFNNDNTAVTLEGCTFTTDSAVTISSGGQTITAGGQTITAGDQKVVGGNIFGGQKIYVGGVTTAAPCLMTGTVAPAVYGALGSIYIDTQNASLYVQTATDAWKQFATPF